MKVTLTQYDRYIGQIAGPFNADMDPSLDFDGKPDHDVLEYMFTTGYVSVGDRITIERERRERTWRCDPEGWSIVIDPSVFYTYVDRATGRGRVQRFYLGAEVPA